MASVDRQQCNRETTLFYSGLFATLLLDRADGKCDTRPIELSMMGCRVMPSASCQSCKKFVPIFAAGKCHACFATWGAANSVPTELMPAHCPVDGCDGYAVKRGLCDRHYRRFFDHGTTDKVRKVAESRRHPEYKNWTHFKTHGKLCEQWLSFWAFAEAIGERPSPRHWLDRPDSTQLYGPENFEWRAPKLDVAHTANTTEGRRAYQQALRAQTDRYWVGSNLKRYYGMTRAQYDALLESQGGGCAICGREEDRQVDGTSQLLAVDHDHESGEVRGLLCRQHNMMVGQSNDSPEALRKAADYLDQPHHTGLFVPKPGDMPKDREWGAANAAAGGICQEPECGLAVKAKGLCPSHYMRFLRQQNAPAESAPKPLAACTTEGCEQRAVARGFCQTHYMRWRRHGSAETVLDTHGRPIPPQSS
jgi:hypothetical protein